MVETHFPDKTMWRRRGIGGKELENKVAEEEEVYEQAEQEEKVELGSSNDTCTGVTNATKTSAKPITTCHTLANWLRSGLMMYLQNSVHQAEDVRAFKLHGVSYDTDLFTK